MYAVYNYHDVIEKGIGTHLAGGLGDGYEETSIRPDYEIYNV